VGLATGDEDEGAAELTAGEFAGADVGVGDVGSGCVVDKPGDEFEDDDNGGADATDAALLWEQALAAAITVAAVQAALTALRPHPCLATARA